MNGNFESSSPNVNRSFLLWWVLANIVGLPALLLPYGIGFSLILGLAILSDGATVGSIWYVFIFIILALSGAMIGAWFGFMQWLPLRARILQSRKWIGASSFGVAIGSPLSWLVYRWIFESPIANRPDGFYFSFGYAYVTFGVLLGLAIGVSQWSVLRQQVYGAGWWIIVLPICFALGISFANFYLLSGAFALPIHRLTQRLIVEIPGLEISNMQILGFFAVISAITALVGVGLITGILLRRLLRFPKIEREGQ